jgi:hypothetical protein
MRYTRPQLTLLLALAGAALVGLGVRQWRAGFPEHAARLERFDQEEPIAWSAAPAVVAPGRARERSSRASPRTEPAAREPRAMARAEPAPADPRPLDLNLADAEQIARLPGVGPALARRIVAVREQRGELASADDLRGVLGLGPKKIAALRELVVARATARRAEREAGDRASPDDLASATEPGVAGASADEPPEPCEGTGCGPPPGDSR